MIYPTVLEGVIPVVAPNLPSAPTDFRGLQNKTDKILRVDELRFWVMDSDLDSGFWIADRDGFATGEVRIRIGNEPITADFVPLPAMTWPNDFHFEGNISEVGLAVTGSAMGGYFLRFSKPVYLHPGHAITMQFRHESANNLRFVVAAVCRDSDGAERGFTPWIAKFSPPAHTDGTGNFIDTSTESDLVNPFDDEMLVERLIGRMFWGVAGNTVDEIGHQSAGGSQARLVFDTTRVRIEDHEATQIVRDATPFGLVFEFIRKSWMINATLASKGFYRVSIESALNVQVVTGTPSPVFAKIGMLGYRAVR